MRKLLWASLIVFFALAQKPLPLNGGQKQEQTQTKPADTQPPAPPPITSEVGKENAANAERYAYYKTHKKEYLKAAIAPANLSNWILAGLGIIGGVLGLLTLLSIKRQADLMAEQNKTVRDRERARISTLNPTKPDFKPVDSFFGPEQVPVLIRIFVINDGDTRAFNAEVVGMLRIDPNSAGKFDPKGIGLDIPKIIRVGTENPVQVTVTGLGAMVGATTSEFTIIPKALADDVREARKSLRIMGVIFYEDVFGDNHETPFNYLWEVPAYDSTGHWVEGCRWIDQSPPST
jgi:hypothetical protein